MPSDVFAFFAFWFPALNSGSQRPEDVIGHGLH